MTSYRLILILLVKSIESLPIDKVLGKLYQCKGLALLEGTSEDSYLLQNSELPFEIGYNGINGKTCVVSNTVGALWELKKYMKPNPLVRVILESDALQSNVSMSFESLYNNEPADFTSSPVIGVRKLHDNAAVLKLLCPSMIEPTKHFLKYTETKWTLSGIDQFQCRLNLKNKMLKVAAMEVPPYVTIKDDGLLTGTDVKVIQAVQSREQFNVEYVMEQEIFNLEFSENGQPEFKGLVGKVYGQEVQLGIAGFPLHAAFYDYVDYMLTYSFYFHYKTGKPKNLPPFLNLVKPFSTTAWIFIMVTLITATTAFMFLSRYVLDKNDVVKNGLTIFMSQFCQVIPNKKLYQDETRLAMKVFLITWYVYTFFIHASYDCNLRAYLMHVDEEKPIDTAKDIVEQGRKVYFFAQFDEREMHEALPDETFKYEKQYARTSYENGYLYSPELESNRMHIERLMIEEGVVIVTTGSHELKLKSNNDRERYGYLPFRLSKYPTRIHPKHAGVVITKESKLKDIFYPVVLRLIEADIIEHYSRSSYYYWRPEKEEKPNTPLNLQHMMIGFYVCISGLVVSVLIFSCEWANVKRVDS